MLRADPVAMLPRDENMELALTRWDPSFQL
jgi:hypothetical protein